MPIATEDPTVTRDPHLIAYRNQMMVRMREEGLTNRQIATVTGLSVQRVHQIMKKEGER